MGTTYYPAMLNIKNKKCAVIGGGEIALRKCLSLIECEASVKVVSLTFKKEFYELEPSRVTLIRDCFQTLYIEDCFLVIAATGENEENKKIHSYCEENRIIVNVTDDPELCSFIAPAYLRRGDLTISISTGGESPALAKRIKDEIAKIYPAEYAQYVKIMGLIRREIMKREYSQPERMQIFDYLSQIPINELNDIIYVRQILK